MIKKLEWDSTFFEQKIGEIILNQYQSSFDLEDMSFDLLYIKSNEKFDLSLMGYKNTFSEVKLTYEKKLKKNSSRIQNIFPFKQTDYNVEDLYELAYESGKHSRFNLDEKFKKNKFQELYRTWIVNSLINKFADGFLVYVENETILGFVSYKISSNTATIGLIAVNPKAQGKGIGGKLLEYIEQELVEKKITYLSIPTQESNKPACSFYEKQGYKIKKYTYIKHYWNEGTLYSL